MGLVPLFSGDECADVVLQDKDVTGVCASCFAVPHDWQRETFAVTADPSDLAGRYARHERERWDIACDDGARPDKGVFSNRHSTNDRGIRADAILRDLASAAGGKGGGKPHMAQAGIPDAARMTSVIAEAPEMIRKHLTANR